MWTVYGTRSSTEFRQVWTCRPTGIDAIWGVAVKVLKEVRELIRFGEKSDNQLVIGLFLRIPISSKTKENQRAGVDLIESHKQIPTIEPITIVSALPLTANENQKQFQIIQ